MSEHRSVPVLSAVQVRAQPDAVDGLLGAPAARRHVIVDGSVKGHIKPLVMCVCGQERLR